MLVCKHAKQHMQNYLTTLSVVPDLGLVNLGNFLPMLLEELEEPCDCADTIAENVSQSLKTISLYE